MKSRDCSILRGKVFHAYITEINEPSDQFFRNSWKISNEFDYLYYVMKHHRFAEE